MAILAGVASILGRFAGQLLNTTLGWATLLLFGKVPANRQMLLLVIVFGSLAWVVPDVGVLVPTVGTLLLSGITLPSFARARAAVSSRLTDAPAYMTTSAEAQHFEDDLAKVRSRADLKPLDERLAKLAIPWEEWDVLYRKRLQVEVELMTGGNSILQPGAKPVRQPVIERRAPALVDLAVAGVGLGLIVLDAVLLFTSRQPRRR
jgi:hypothetical protein